MHGFKPAQAAQQFKKKQRAGYANGGMVRGPGTGTSDEVPDKVPEGTYIMPADSTQAMGAENLQGLGAKNIPVNLSNGEFKLPPEQVHAVGVQALDQMKGATHTPSSTEAAKGMKPELFFEGGGEVQDQQEKLRRQTQAYVIGDQASAAARPPAAVARGLPATAPSVATPSPTAMYFEDGMGDAGKQFDKGEIARGIGTGTRTAMMTPLMAGVEAIDRVATPVVGGVANFARGFFGVQETPPAAAAPKPTGALPVAPTSPAPAVAPIATAAAPATTTAAAALPSATTGPASAAAPVAPDAAQVMPGVYRKGNSYADSVEGLTGSNTGRPNEQNMAAAQNLARGFNPSAAQAQMQPQGVQTPIVRNSTNDFSARKALENAATAASSITANGGRFDSRRGTTSGNQDGQILPPSTQQAAYAAMQRSDLALQNDQPGIEQAAMRERGFDSRSALQQQGENQRSNSRNQIEGQRLQIEGQRVQNEKGRYDLDARAKGFDIRQAERMEGMQNEYLAAQGDPKKAADIAQKMRALNGKSDSADWGVQVTPATKNADGSTTEGSVIRYNKSTGQVERVDGTQGAQAKPQPKTAAEAVAGQVYQTARGPMRWDGKQFMPL